MTCIHVTKRNPETGEKGLFLYKGEHIGLHYSAPTPQGESIWSLLSGGGTMCGGGEINRFTNFSQIRNS
jgi:hypothetical protein